MVIWRYWDSLEKEEGILPGDLVDFLQTVLKAHFNRTALPTNVEICMDSSKKLSDINGWISCGGIFYVAILTSLILGWFSYLEWSCRTNQCPINLVHVHTEKAHRVGKWVYFKATLEDSSVRSLVDARTTHNFLKKNRIFKIETYLGLLALLMIKSHADDDSNKKFGECKSSYMQVKRKPQSLTWQPFARLCPIRLWMPSSYCVWLRNNHIS